MAKAQLAQAQAQLTAEQPNVPIATVEQATQVSTSTDDVATAVAELASAAAGTTFARRRNVDQAIASDKYAQVEKLRMARLAQIGAVRTEPVGSADVAGRRRICERRGDAQGRRGRAEEGRRAALTRRLRAEARRASFGECAEAGSRAARRTVKLREAAVEAAMAQVRQAELNLSYVHIVAPVNGIVGKKGVQIGDRIQPGQALVSVTQTDNVWVTANFRETQLQKMHPRQKVVVHVDALDLDFSGEVDSLPGASGAPLQPASARKRDGQLREGRAAPPGAHSPRRKPEGLRTPPTGYVGGAEHHPGLTSRDAPGPRRLAPGCVRTGPGASLHRRMRRSFRRVRSR